MKQENDLPRAARTRWQALRGGLINLYRYDHEEFHYEQGHLLLRGNNGTGKSRVLALQLPFLLDGETAPHRLEPDADPSKKIEWNLLLNTFKDRLGYSWLELGRLDNMGSEHYLTLGIGLHAVTGRGLVGKWFFVTKQRIGRDLFLQDEAGLTLTRPRLIERLGERGQVFTTAERYRGAVDELLFKLGPHRYKALVNLLIQLRQPQLSRKLDERKLSAALSEALQPVSEHIIGDVAESFRGLEQDRHELQTLEAARKGVASFLDRYRRYAQIAARRRAEGVRKTHATYEETQRRLRRAEKDHEDATREHSVITGKISDLKMGEKEGTARVNTLENSPEMRDARALDAACLLAGEKEKDADRAGTEAEQAREWHRRSVCQWEEASRGAEAVRKEVEKAGERAVAGAERLAIEHHHRRMMNRIGFPDVADVHGVRTARDGLEEITQKLRRGADHLKLRNGKLDEAVAALSRASEKVNELESQVTEAVAHHRGSHQALEKTARSLLVSYEDWAGNLEELEPDSRETLVEAWLEWSRDPEGANPMADAVSRAHQRAAERLAAQKAEGRRALADLETEAGQLRAERSELVSGVHKPPPVPYTRDPELRADQPGAPLWALCDFNDAMAVAQRAGMEAALEAAGLLDAWLYPDGRLRFKDHEDAVLIPEICPLPEEGRHLDGLLAPSIDPEDVRAHAVDPVVVRRVLRHLGFGEGSGPVWVDDEGHWQNGPLRGCWHKAEAEHLGRAAREALRRRRLAELAAAIAEAENKIGRFRTVLENLERRLGKAKQEAEAAPGPDPIFQDHGRIDAAARQVDELRTRLARSEKDLAVRRETHSRLLRERDREAADLRLTAWIDDLDGLIDRIHEYQTCLATLWGVLQRALSARLRAEAEAAGMERAGEEARRRAELFEKARAGARTAIAQRDILQESIGAASEEIRARLTVAREQLNEMRTQLEEAVRRERELFKLKVKVEFTRENLGQALEEQAEKRGEAITNLGRLAATRLLAVVLPGGAEEDPEGWSVSKAVEVARTLETTLSGVKSDDEAWNRNARNIMIHIEELKDALLPHNFRPMAVNEYGIFVVTAEFRGKNRTMAGFLEALKTEIRERGALLDAREREVLENHLIGEVATHLHERLRSAEELVHQMNREIQERPTSTGMALRFVWMPRDDGPDGLPEARKRLLGVGETWSPAEREALGDFLQRQIKRVRLENDTATWQESLETALDYRAWHHFSVERRQENQWKRLTRRTHGTGSGGEKAIALTIPQFAAAAAHYRSASPSAPRLIMMDEAFVGVDDDMRAKCMGLLQAFDLDFLMTSEREWGCYPTLPGLAIYQLATRPGIDAVALTRWVWNGRSRTVANPVLSSARPPAGPPEYPLLGETPR